MHSNSQTNKDSEIEFAKVPRAPSPLSSETNFDDQSKQDTIKNQNIENKITYKRVDATLSIMAGTGHPKNYEKELYSVKNNSKFKEIKIKNESSFNPRAKNKMNRKRFNETLIKTSKMTTRHLSGPSIPGRTQKILKKSPHAQQVNKFLNGSMRYRIHKRGSSLQTNLDNSFSKEDIIKLAERARPSSLLREKRKGFSTSSHRFDKKFEFERFYDTTPGPGSYNLIKKLTDKAQELKDIHDKNSDFKKNQKNRSTISSIMNNSAILQPQTKLEPIQKGTFGLSQRIAFESENSPGPGQYNSVDLEKNSNKKRIISYKMKDKRPALKLPFSLSNPLNYVNSYTVNVYYKPGFPEAGFYNPDTDQSNVRGDVKFDMKSKRKELFPKTENTDVPIQYDSHGAFNKKFIGLNNSPGLCQPTSRKLVHLSMFGDGSSGPNAEASSKDQENKIKPHSKELKDLLDPKKVQNKSLLPNENGMGDLSRDRFGAPIESKSVKFKTPGPGAYENDYIQSIKKNSHKLCMIGQSERNYTFGMDNIEINPGPAYYDPPVVDKKISFHYDRAD
ncbi:unnamed protein product [Moneuplotes crassus]|uniref:Uncharacterized protein n=1 Tax=Euplotes crassus TaxID=5936 RepID=A0AAD1YAC4_EUPCR|nr:unnamed protein product [Moneuplotes crassus]